MADVGIAAFGAVVSKITEWVLVPIGRQIGFAFSYKKNIEELREQVEKLADRRERVRHSVDIAHRQGDEIEKDVEKWLTRVKDLIERVERSTVEDEDKAKNRCFKRLCPSPVTRYWINKKAVKAANDCVHYLRESESWKHERVSYDSLPQRMNSVLIRDYENFDSRKQIFQDIMETLNIGNFNMIGVYGMGGVGKTTLVKKVAWQAMEDKLFDVLVIVEVTENPDPKKIQGEIADQLGLKFQEESESGRAARLCKRLKKEKRVLVILDNIWAKLDLEAIGIPFGGYKKASVITQEVDQEGRNDNQRQCKILLTSRNLHILSNDMNTQRNFLVQNLLGQEPKNLFWKNVGNAAEKPDFQSIADKIVEKCAGSPIAIVTIANALKNKHLPVWKDALVRLTKSDLKYIKGMEANVYSAIELSYNFLESEEEKSIFLICALLDAGYSVSIDFLLAYAMAFSWFQDFETLEEGRNRVRASIDNLKASCLVLEINGSIKMHDIIHAVAVSIASENGMFNIQNVNCLREESGTKINQSSTAISLPFRSVSELPQRLEYPNLRIFTLVTRNLSVPISNAFFERLKELRVLDLAYIRFPSLPSSLCCLRNLQTLKFTNCLLGDIAIIGELKSLEILSFDSSEIEKLPGEIGLLTRLRVLIMNYCTKLKIITPNVISSLTQLEELYMRNCFIEWDVEGQNNASLAELKHLPRLTALTIHISDAQVMRDLCFEKLDRFRILIGDVWDRVSKDEFSRTLKLKLSNKIYLSHVIEALLKKTEDLCLDELKGVKNVLYEIDSDGFQQLKHLHVQNIPEIQYIVNSRDLAPCIDSFPKLESLFLHNLINLAKVCHGKLTSESFSKLKIMKVEKCNKLKHLISVAMVRRLPNLQEIEVIDCKNLIEIVSKESEGHVEENEGSSKIELTHLRSLRLQCLPQLSCFGFNVKMPVISESSSTADMGFQEIVVEDDLPLFSENVVLPSLETLKLSSINIECRWLDQFPVISSCCQTLTSLIVEECGGLKFLFSYSIIESMAQLQILEIRNCKSMEGIINTEELGGEGNTMKVIFRKLRSLQLKGLPNLTRFGSGSSVEFPSLTALEIEGCPNLKTFFSGSMCADIVVNKEPQEMHLDNCGAAGHFFFDEKVVSPALASLNLFFISSQTIWHKQAISSCFQNLTKLIVIDCDNLKYLFSSSMVESLVQLKVLHICNCKSMEEVIVSEEERLTQMFPLLHELMLKDLPKLIRFCCYVRNFIELSSLSWLWIASCPNMETFICNYTNVDMPAKMESLEELKSESEENLHTDIPLFNEKVRLPALKLLHIEHMGNLKTIWHNKQLIGFDSCKLESLGVVKCNKLSYVFPSNMLGRLPKLVELWILSCDSLQEIFELEALGCVTAPQLRKLVLRYLPKLKQVVDSQDYVFFQNLISIEIQGCNSLKSLFPAKIAKVVPRLEMLHISSCNMVEEIVAKEEELEDHPTFVFPQLTSLLLSDLSSLKGFYPGLYISKWPVLKKLRIVRCNKVKLLTSEFSSLRETHGESQGQISSIQQPLFLVDKVAFPNLEELSLEWNCIVKEIQNGKFSDYSCKLKVFEVLHATKGNAICPSCFLFTLPVLEKLDVIHGIFEDIFRCEGSGCKEKHVAGPSKLRHLTLFNLFPSSYPRKESSLPCNVFQNLATLAVSTCVNIRNLEPFSVSFQNLTSLEVSQCHKLLNLGALSTIKSLLQLRRMSIIDCQMIEEIIAHTGDEMEDQIIFKQLTYLGLQCLPSVRSFYSGNCTIEFPSLQQVVLRQCPNMKFFSQGVLNAPKLHRVQMIEAKDGGCWEDDLNTTILKLFKDMVGFSGLQHLTLSKFPHLKEVWNDQLPVRFFCSLKTLVMDDCANWSSAISGNLLKCLNSLNKLDVRNCETLEEVFDLEELNANGNFKVLSQLSQFNLVNLSKLRHIWKENHPQGFSFRNLTLMKVDNCSSLGYLFTPSVVLGLEQLQKLEIVNCAMMEEIITMEREMDGSTDKITFLRLNSIILESLPNLTSFYSGSNTLECPSLTNIDIEDCPKMETFVFLNMKDLSFHSASLFNEKVVLPVLEFLDLSGICIQSIWHNQLLQAISSSFQNLTKLIMHGCDNLKYLFPTSMAESLVHLEFLKISNCKFVEGVIITQEERKSSTLLPKLNQLKLKDLPELTRFCNFSGYLIDLPSLLKLVIKKCPNMQTFVSDSACADMSAIEEPKEANTEETIYSFFDEKVAFPCLKELKMRELPELLHLWKEGSQHSIIFENLTNLDVSDCENLKTLVPSSVSLQKLMTLTLQRCNGLMNLLTLSSAKTLVQLESLDIECCKLVEEIITDKGDEETKTAEGEIDVSVDKIAFRMLDSIILESLPSLKSFYSGSNTLECPSLTTISIKECPKMNTLVFPKDISIYSASFFSEQAISSCFQYLMELTFDGCDNLKYLFPTSMAESFIHLEFLEISNCKHTEGIIITEKERINSTLFPKLEQLKLKDLQQLKRFCNFKGDSIELPSLSKLKIKNCPKMQTFASDFLCADMPAIEEPKEANTEETNYYFFDEKAIFPFLNRLVLCELPKMLHLWKGNSQPSKVFENLAHLEVSGCGNLITLVPSSVSLQNLERLEVQKCDRLINLVTFSTAKSLEKLKIMKIVDCKTIEEIIVDVRDEIKDVIVFNQLKYLKLSCLPSITNFCKGNFTIEFPYLQRVLVIECLKMMTFSQGVLSTPKLQRIHLKEEEAELHWEFRMGIRGLEDKEDGGCWEGDLNTTIQKLFKDVNAESCEQN